MAYGAARNGVRTTSCAALHTEGAMAQVVEHKIWKIIELFYRSFLAYRHIHDQYEENVAGICAKNGTSRDALQLSPIDLAGLIEFQKLEDLRDRYLFTLKDYCHDIFRDRDQTDLLDRYVSDIFHEISILKEEHYTVKHYALYWARTDAQAELQAIMGEALKLVPHKIQHVDFLYRTARERLETLLPGFRGQKILTRSLFLNRDDFIAESHPRGIEGLYELMYPEHGPLAGFVEAGESFFASAFYTQAKDAFELGREYHRRLPRDTETEARLLATAEERLAAIAQALAADRARGEAWESRREPPQ